MLATKHAADLFICLSHKVASLLATLFYLFVLGGEGRR